MAAAIGFFTVNHLTAGGACCGGSAEKKAEWSQKKLEKMSKKLKLNDEQKAKLKGIFDKKQKDMEAPAQQMASIRGNSCKEISEMLTDAQKKDFEKMCSKHGHGKSCEMMSK